MSGLRSRIQFRIDEISRNIHKHIAGFHLAAFDIAAIADIMHVCYIAVPLNHW